MSSEILELRGLRLGRVCGAWLRAMKAVATEQSGCENWKEIVWMSVHAWLRRDVKCISPSATRTYN